MNYIKQIQQENQELRQRTAAMDELLQELVEYCQSSKFQGPENKWVNPEDIVRRVRQGKHAIEVGVQ